MDKLIAAMLISFVNTSTFYLTEQRARKLTVIISASKKNRNRQHPRFVNESKARF